MATNKGGLVIDVNNKGADKYLRDLVARLGDVRTAVEKASVSNIIDDKAIAKVNADLKLTRNAVGGISSDIKKVHVSHGEVIKDWDKIAKSAEKVQGFQDKALDSLSKKPAFDSEAWSKGLEETLNQVQDISTQLQDTSTSIQASADQLNTSLSGGFASAISDMQTLADVSKQASSHMDSMSTSDAFDNTGISDSFDSVGESGDEISVISSQMDDIKASSEATQQSWQDIAMQMSNIAVLTPDVQQMAVEAGTLSTHMDAIADTSVEIHSTWQDTVRSIAEINETTTQINRRMAGLIGSEMLNSLDHVKQSSNFIDTYWKSIYQNAEAVRSVNKYLGHEAFQPESGSQSILKYVQFSQRLLLEQKGLAGRMRVLRQIAEEETQKNRDLIAKVQNDWDALEVQKNDALMGLTDLSAREKNRISQRQDELITEKKLTEEREQGRESEIKRLDFLNKSATVLGQIKDVVTFSNKESEKRADLEDKILWIQQQQAISQGKAAENLNGAVKTLNRVQVAMGGLSQMWGDMANSAEDMQNLDIFGKFGLAGQLKDLSIDRIASSLAKDQSSFRGKMRALQYRAESGMRQNKKMVEDLQSEWDRVDMVINDATKGYINITAQERDNLLLRQDTIKREQSAADKRSKQRDFRADIYKIGAMLGNVTDGIRMIGGKSHEVAKERIDLEKTLIGLTEMQMMAEDKRAVKLGNINNIASYLTGNYTTQQSVVKKQAGDLSTVYGQMSEMERVSALIAEHWTKIGTQMMDVLHITGQIGSEDIASQLNDVKPIGFEAIANKLVESRDTMQAIFRPQLIKQWSDGINKMFPEMKKEFTSLQEIIADPRAFKVFAPRIRDMFFNQIKTITGFTDQMVNEMVDKVLPSVQMVEDAAAKGQDIQIAVDIQDPEKLKNQLIDVMMGAQRKTGQTVDVASFLTSDEQIRALEQNAGRLAGLFDENFIAGMVKDMPKYKNNEAFKTLADFMGNQEAWADVGHNFTEALAKQIAAITGQPIEWAYTVAHRYMPALKEVSDVAHGMKADFDSLTVDQIGIDPNAFKASLQDALAIANKDPSTNAEFYKNKGREYNLEDEINKAVPPAPKIIERVKAARQKIKDEISTLFPRDITEIQKLLDEATAGYNERIAAGYSDKTTRDLAHQKEQLEKELANVGPAGDRNEDQKKSAERRKMMLEFQQVGLTIAQTGVQVGSVIGSVTSAAIKPLKAIFDMARGINDETRAEAKTRAEIQKRLDAAENSEQLRRQMVGGLVGDLRKATDQMTGMTDAASFDEFVANMRVLPQESKSATDTWAKGAREAERQYAEIVKLQGQSTNAAQMLQLQSLAEEKKGLVDQYREREQNWSRELVDNITTANRGLKSFGDEQAQRLTGLADKYNEFAQSGIAKSLGLDIGGSEGLQLGGLENFSQNMETFKTAMTGLTGVLTSVGVAAGTITSIIATLTTIFMAATSAIAGVFIGMQVFDKLMGRSASDIAKAKKSYDQFVENMSASFDALANASEGSVQAQIFDEQRQLLESQAAYDLAVKNAQNKTDTIAMLRSLAENAITHSGVVYGEFGEEMGEQIKEMQKHQQTIENLKSIEGITEDFAKFKKVLEKNEDAMRTVMDTQLQLIDGEKEYAKSLAEAAEERRRQSVRDEEQKGMDELFAQEDWATERLNAYTENLKSIEDIEKEFFKSVQESEKDLNKARAEAYTDLMKSLSDIDKDEAKSVSEAEEEYQDQQTDDLESHLKEMKQAEDDYQKEKLRREQDLWDQLNDLELSNDALGYLQAQRDGKKEAKRADEDHKEQMGQSEEQFQEQRDEQQISHDTQMEDMKLQNAERRLELVTQYQEEKIQRQKEFDESIAQMKVDADERSKQEAEAYGKSEAEAWHRLQLDQSREEARTALQERYAKEDLALQQKQQQDQFNAEQQQLHDQQDAALKQLADHGMDVQAIMDETNSLIESGMTTSGENRVTIETGFNTAMETLQKAHHDMVYAEEQANQQRILELLRSNNSAYAGGGTPGYASGGEPPLGKVSMVGEGGPELFIPKERGQVIPAGQTAKILSLFSGSIGDRLKALSQITGYAAGGIAAKGKRILAGELGGEMFLPDRTGDWPSGKMPDPSKKKRRKLRAGGSADEECHCEPQTVVNSLHYKLPGAEGGGSGGSGSSSSSSSSSTSSAEERAKKKAAETAAEVAKMQAQFQESLKNIQSTVGDYHVNVAGQDKDYLEKMREAAFKSHTEELEQYQSFARSMADSNSAYNHDLLNQQQKSFAELTKSNDSGYKDQLKIQEESFLDRLDQIVNHGDEEMSEEDKQQTAVSELRKNYNDDDLAVIDEYNNLKEDALEVANKNEADLYAQYATDDLGSVETHQHDLDKSRDAYFEDGRTAHDAQDKEMLKMTADTNQLLTRNTQGFQRDQQTQYSSGSQTVLGTVQQMWGGIQTGANTTMTSIGLFIASMTNMTTAIATATASIMSQMSALRSASASSGGGYGQSGLQPRALGGDIVPGQKYVVGEHGPELFVSDKSGSMIPYADLAKGGKLLQEYAKGNQMMAQLQTQMRNMPSRGIDNKMFYSYPQRGGQGGNGQVVNQFDLHIDQVSVGSDMSRAEIEGQFNRMRQSIVKIMAEAVN